MKKYKEEDIVIVCFVQENVILTKEDKIITRIGSEDIFKEDVDKASDYYSDTVESFIDECNNTINDKETLAWIEENVMRVEP